MNIVFAHFNSKIPKHLALNLQRSRNIFDKHEIFLITDKVNDKFKIEGVNTVIYKPSPGWIISEKTLNHPKNFRDNFWFTSLARFIAISEFARGNRGEVLHIESDVILSKHFPFDILSSQKELFQFPIVNNSLAISSVLYLKNSEAAEILEQTTLSEVSTNPGTTDMHILRKLSKTHSSFFRALPSLPSNSNVMNHPDTEFIKVNENLIQTYGGIFDGFDIGKYLFGEDPRNNRGFSRLRRTDLEVYLNPRKLDFSISSSHDFPEIYDNKKKMFIPIYALHIHCKHYKFFIVDHCSVRIQKYIRDSRKPSSFDFYPKVFLASIMFAVLRRIRRFRVYFKAIN